MPKLDQDVKDALSEILKQCKNDDLELYKARLKEWKKLEEYWHGVQFLFWSDKDQTWLTPANVSTRQGMDDEDTENFGPFYDYVVNIYKSHGEAIIAALSAKLPAMRWVPDDADDNDDTVTARTYSKISDLIQRHNNAALIFLKGIFFLWNGGIVASYRYKDADVKYGTYDVPQYGEEEVPVQTLVCPECGYTENPEGNENGPVDSLAGTSCPQCGEGILQVQEELTKQTVQTGTQTLPKTRVKMETYGPLQFKINEYATSQASIEYLLLYLDNSKSSIKSALQPDLKETELTKSIDGDTISDTNRLSRSGYLYPDDPQNETRSMTTMTKCWFRPSNYWKVKEEKTRQKLAKLFPNGIKCTFVGKKDLLVDNDTEHPEDESLDKRWDIGKAGLSTYIHSDPLGKPLVPIQDMKNQLVNMTMDVIDHGNPSTYADSEAINFDQYGKTEALPGYLYKAKKKPGESLASSFHTEPRVSLSKEVPMFNNQLDQGGQFVVGSFPSIYGGPSEGKSRTFAEYQQSRAMALQRLQIVWVFIVDWWKRNIEGCVRMYVETVVEDDKFVQHQGGGKYINVWIRQSELKGRVGAVESEASDQFPMSLMQKNAVLMKLIELNNPFINSALYTPENSRILQDVLALNEFKLPGEDQRIKQVYEMDALMKEEPIDRGIPSVPIDPDVDDDAVHIATCRSFLVDQVGLDLKDTNPAGYMNIIYHMKDHEQNLMVKTMTMQHNAPPGQEPESAEGKPE